MEGEKGGEGFGRKYFQQATSDKDVEGYFVSLVFGDASPQELKE